MLHIYFYITYAISINLSPRVDGVPLDLYKTPAKYEIIEIGLCNINVSQ